MRIWYNIRRAYERKKNTDVERNSVEDEPAPHSPSSDVQFAGGDFLKDEAILLPTMAFADDHKPMPYVFGMGLSEVITGAFGCDNTALPVMHGIQPSLSSWVLPSGTIEAVNGTQKSL